MQDDANPYRKLPRGTLEAMAAGIARDKGSDLANARVEILRRDREYDGEQEPSRRKFETDHQAARQEFEEKLAQRQMDHAAAVAKEQLDTARAAAKAATMAAWAAGVAALGAIGQIIVAVLK
jgi:hypothetical protein